MKQCFLLALLLVAMSFPEQVCAQSPVSLKNYTTQDSLRGSLGAARTWWNVQKYDISLDVDIRNRAISGSNEILFEVLKDGASGLMQIDLQEPMQIEKIESANESSTLIPFRKDKNVWWLDFGKRIFKKGEVESIKIFFKGIPHQATMPPWDGGWVWQKDAKGRPWVTVACQGIGASIWYPCKDHQSDEPDKGASLSITVPDTLVAVGNGRLINKKDNENGTQTWLWKVNNPINNYTIVPYIGKYVNWTENFKGVNGNLDCSYWVMDYDLEKAKKQFAANVPQMLSCFEHLFGPYPFYDDSYKLVETSHLGMEHQSAVAYGNKFMNGYLGMDLSGTGKGKSWDYIIIHESGHEWFANNITTNDIADMWVHEGFTNYSEVLFVECQQGKEAGNEYVQGLRKGIENSKPIIGHYGINQEGSGDMYAKGANIIHTIRQLINDDNRFLSILKGLNKEFYHRTINSKDVEEYISRSASKDFRKIFDQYLRQPGIPTLEYKLKAGKKKTDPALLSFHWVNTIKGFNMPVKIMTGTKSVWINPTSDWQQLKVPANFAVGSVDKNFYINLKKANL